MYSNLIKYNSYITDNFVNNLLRQNSRLNNIIIHSTPTVISNKVIVTTKLNITWTNEVIDDEKCCGVTAVGYFLSNIELFNESLFKNNCLNQKISINSKGYISNCPSMFHKYGHIDDTSLYDALIDDKFQFLWNINKDQISICKDCEFRYICTDCRAYILEEQNIFSKPIKCKYNPYEAVWEN